MIGKYTRYGGSISGYTIDERALAEDAGIRGRQSVRVSMKPWLLVSSSHYTRLLRRNP